MQRLEIAFKLFADDVVRKIVALAVTRSTAVMIMPGGAEAALQAVVLAERLLHRMQRRAVGGSPRWC